jgi:hypothetical protein
MPGLPGRPADPDIEDEFCVTGEGMLRVGEMSDRGVAGTSR